VAIVSHGKVRDSDLYPEAPIVVRFLSKTEAFYTQKATFSFQPLSATSFKLEQVLEEGGVAVLPNHQGSYAYGTPIRSKLGVFVVYVLDAKDLKAIDDSPLLTIEINPLEDVAESFRNRLKVNPLSKTSSVVELSLVDPLQKRAEDYLDHLVAIYNDNAVSDKNTMSLKTSEFINKRLELITEELDGVEKDVEQFKSSNNLTDIDTQAKLFVEGSGEYNKKV